MSPTFAQLDAGGRLRHLLTLEGLPRGLLESLLERATAFAARPGHAPVRGEALGGSTLVNLFAEPSTRTRASFELAAVRLGGDVLNFDNSQSSRAKGETLLDTVHTLLAMQTDYFVIRDGEAGVQERVAREVDGQAAVVSAGEAHLSHPTQGLLDAMTIREHKGDFGQLAIAIVGDIARSRVARSAHQALKTLGAREIRIVAPRAMMPEAAEFAGARRLESLDDGIAGADVVMMLRIQHERAGGAGSVDLAGYHREFGLTASRLARAAPKAIVMHPGPMNRGVEIDSDVADGPQSVIRRQVANGVAVRMAVLERLAAARRARAG
jgi:aspartate carbamoyltransferase catalytic subunit